MPLPGTQEQELGNITFPAPYNVFEFAVTCMACHGGSVDQNVGARRQLGRHQHGLRGARPDLPRQRADREQRCALAAGNLCFRCHSPNGWYSGRFNPSSTATREGGT